MGRDRLNEGMLLSETSSQVEEEVVTRRKFRHRQTHTQMLRA